MNSTGFEFQTLINETKIDGRLDHIHELSVNLDLGWKTLDLTFRMWRAEMFLLTFYPSSDLIFNNLRILKTAMRLLFLNKPLH